jgi:hypothetical protein
LKFLFQMVEKCVGTLKPALNSVAFGKSVLAGVLLVLLLFVFFACRVEATRSLSVDSSAAESLFFSDTDTFGSGVLDGEIFFGSGHTSLEPPEKTSLAGFGGASRRLLPPNPSGMGKFFTYCLPYNDVDLAPRVKAQVWTSDQVANPATGEDRNAKVKVYAIVALDVVAVPADVSKRIVAHLQKNIDTYIHSHPMLRGKTHGIEINHGNIQIVASHTHSGPAGLTKNPFWSIFACDRYSDRLFSFFQGQVESAFLEALRNSQPVKKVYRREQLLPGFSKSRIRGMVSHSRQLVYVFDKNDTREQESDSKRGLPCLNVFAVHPTWYGAKSLTLSSDVVGYLERELKDINRGTECLFLNGAVGNAELVYTSNLTEYAQKYAEITFSTGTGGWEESIPKLEYGSRIVKLPLPKPNLKACKVPPIEPLVGARILDNLPSSTMVSFLKMGETLFVFYPGEAVETVQKQLETEITQTHENIKKVQILSVSNDYVGYLVDSNNFDSTTLEACSTLYGKDITTLLKTAVLDMISPSSKQNKQE